jgi:hypothetical protein
MMKLLQEMAAAEAVDATETEVYTYQPLETATTIRLLVLCPGQVVGSVFDPPLKGYFRHVDLNSPNYPAFDPLTMPRVESSPPNRQLDNSTTLP